MPIHARFKAARYLIGHDGSRHGNNRHATGRAFQPANRHRCSQAIHARHAHIHQHQIISGGTRGAERFFTITRQIHRIAGLAQNGGGNKLIGFAILGNQDAPARAR